VIPELGQFALILALCLALVQGTLPIAGAAYGRADWLALALLLTGLFGYRFFLSIMLRNNPEHLFLGKLQKYRTAWIEAHAGNVDSVVVVQTLRNTIMSASFLASTAVILIMGAFNMMRSLDSAADPAVVKLLLIIVLLAYSFFNFTLYIRETNYMSFILNIPREQLDEIENGNSTSQKKDRFRI